MYLVNNVQINSESTVKIEPERIGISLLTRVFVVIMFMIICFYLT